MNTTTDSTTTTGSNALNDESNTQQKSPSTSELELLEKKIMKCGREINLAKQKMQSKCSSKLIFILVDYIAIDLRTFK